MPKKILSKAKPKPKQKVAVKSKGVKNKKVAVKSKAAKNKKVLPIPKGYAAITSYLFVIQADKAIDFYKKVFGAKEVKRMEQPNGNIAHAELQIGDTKIMLAEENPHMQAHSPHSFGGTPVMMHFYVKNVDATVETAVTNGAILKRPVEDMFYGDRGGLIEDPFGHVWHIATHIENVTTAQMKKRAMAMYSERQQA